MRKKLNLSAMAKKIENNRKEELNAKRMDIVQGGGQPIPWPYEWIESLCKDWCSVGEKHFVHEHDDFDNRPNK